MATKTARFLGQGILFVLIGALVAAVGELQYSVFIRGDVPNLLGSIGFNALYLSAAYGLTAVLLHVLGKRPLSALLLAGLAGLAGLMVEWFTIGNSPWGNPQAVQAGMAAYWACMILVPLLLLEHGPASRPWRRRVLLYALVYTALALVAELVPSTELRYVYHIWSVVVGYIVLAILCVIGLTRTWNKDT
jgi:hypothetical protein